MSIFYLLLVALIQGLTEFLPVSSSGHLILLPQLTGMQDQGLTIDVAVHVGTLGAVILFFWADVKTGFAGIPRMLTGRIDTDGSKLAFLLLVATIPVIIIGLVVKITGLSDAMRSMTVIGWTMLIFGLVLYWFDKKGAATKVASDWNRRDAITLGLWQAIAIIPGTSRSGITITGARALGYTREDSAKISMLMSIPTIMASGILLGLDVAGEANYDMMKYAALGAAFAFVAALLALTLMMRLLRSVSFAPYVYYRVVLGIILLGIAYS
ncbi:undecaprenyl-diphosphate phosphatase [Celeribacter marinus]|uniref:Undecaprenyl-diphosphatase n=1 Tax=Celeribacter marinus TaxID=1397108 RepID=A0A0P0ABV0_9RHOB|nr:undecaprenyl-diphosphate phosphatase [Celeribacter marinus]ALI55787.1 undecaprenyl-diphosphatase [Celeribacter marinus]SFK91364.1 Undecaprenyl-diphosphatase [Celeribacter marinus]